jgi:hypothetical protein
VTISPAGAVTAGAQWQVDGGAFQSSGATVSGLSVGNHTVSFSTISSWTTPANQTVSVSANSSATATGIYVAQTGAPAGYFWLYETVNNNYVFEKIDPASGAVLQTITAPGWPTHPINGGDFAYGNGYFWLYETVNGNYVFEKIDPASGAVLQTITAPGSSTHPINGGDFAYGNGYFWLYETVNINFNSNYVFEKIDPTSGAVLQTTTAPGPPTYLINGGDFAFEQQLNVSTSSSPGNGAVTITFTGTLTSSSTVNGTYTAVAGATSPYTVPITNGAQFYKTHN